MDRIFANTAPHGYPRFWPMVALTERRRLIRDTAAEPPLRGGVPK
jgi:hypothetical protein